MDRALLGGMNRIATALTITLLLASSAGFAQAQDEPKPLKLKSTTAAWILGFDPIPGDALLYAGKKTQGTVNAIVGGIFCAGFFGSLAGYLTEPDPDPQDPNSLSGMGRTITGGLMIITGVPYLGFLIWDAVGGINGVHKHNEKVRNQKRSIWKSIQPTLAVTHEGFLAGAQISF